MDQRVQIQKVLSLIYTAKSALYLDPLLMSSKTVTTQVGKLNEASNLIKKILLDMSKNEQENLSHGN